MLSPVFLHFAGCLRRVTFLTAEKSNPPEADKPIETPDRADVGIAPYSEERRIFQHRGGAARPAGGTDKAIFSPIPQKKIAPADPAKTVRSAGAECICV